MSSSKAKMSNATATTLITVNKNEEHFDAEIGMLSDIKFWLIVIVIIIIKLILIKFVKACKKAYEVHNETLIRRHNRTTPQISVRQI